MKTPRTSHRRGAAYLLVVGVSALVSMVAVAGVLVQRVQTRSRDAINDAAEARVAALSALELAAELVNSDANWRTNRTAGTWLNNVTLGRARIRVDATDPTDGNLANRPHDSLQITATATVGAAQHVSRMTLTAAPSPLPLLNSALHVRGQLHTHGAGVINGSGSLVSTDGVLRNDGIIAFNVECGSVSTRGTVAGQLTTGVTAKTLPPASTVTFYRNLGTAINPGLSIDKQAIGPGRNPWGAPNAEGVYVWQPTGDASLKNSRIVGTLVVVMPVGKKLTVENCVSLQPARSDYPALIVVGDATFKYETVLDASGGEEEGSTTGKLSEYGCSTNFNPTGVPNTLGASDNDSLDLYPSEIRGLVHTTGVFKADGNLILRGAVIAESNAASDAAEVHHTLQIEHDKTLATSPPQGYTSEVKMVRQAGSVSQVVN